MTNQPSSEAAEQQLRLLAAHRKTLAGYVEQEALFGRAYTPPQVRNGLSESRENIRRIKELLQSWNVEFPDDPNDEEPPLSDNNSGGPGGPLPQPSNINIGSRAHVHDNNFGTITNFIRNIFHPNTSAAVKAGLRTFLICTLLLYLLAVCARDKVFCFLILMFMFCPIVFFYALLGYNFGRESNNGEIKKLGTTLLVTSIVPYLITIIFVVIRLGSIYIQAKLKGQI